MIDIRSAARALGGTVTGRNSITCPGPGHGRADRSMSVTFDSNSPDGFVCYSFANDDWQACRDLVRDALGIGAFEPGRGKYDTVSHLRIDTRPVEPDAAAVKRRDFAASLWAEAKPIGGTPAETYLAKARGIELTGSAYDGRALRFHARCPFRLDNGEAVYLPAMLGAMTDATTSEFAGVHRTALQPDGSGKAQVRGLDTPKKMLGSSRNAVVRLSADEDVTAGLGIAEGVETGLAILALGWSPVWAVLSANTMRLFPVLDGLESITIFADHDRTRVIERKSGTIAITPGADAATACAIRWQQAGREAVIWTPPDVGTDFADIAGRAA